MEQYNVTGMSCAACSARVEKAVGKVPGVTACSVSLLTNSMGVEGTASPEAIIQAVQEAGYDASPKQAGSSAQASPSGDGLEALADHETPKLRRRLIASLGFLAVLMYFSMGHMMWGWPLPGWFEGNHVKSDSRGAQHGYPGVPGVHGILCLEHLRGLYDDRRPAPWGQRPGDGIHDGAVL